MPAFKSHTSGTADVAWDAGAQEKKVRSGEARSYYARIYAWYDASLDEGNKSTYKFIHHAVDAGGNPGDAVTKACTSGIGVLNGGMGGTNIPKADFQGVWNHLAKHLRDAGREPPPLSESEELELESESESGPVAHVHGHDELMRLASGEVWAILPSALEALLLAEHGGAPAEPQALTRPGPKSGLVARVPILGSITRGHSLWSMLFGGATVENLIKTLRELGSDPSIGTVLLDVDSPGGTVSGIPELAAEVRALAGKKHVVALANSLAASAAYWIASQADEIVATPEALIGSIGVFAVHADMSARMEQAGIKMTYISAGKYKTEGNPDEPLSDEARAHLQSLVDDSYRLFIADVAAGRQVSAATVRNDYGQGRILTASDAKAAGLIDRVATADETLRRLTGNRAEEVEGKRLANLKRRLELAEKNL